MLNKIRDNDSDFMKEVHKQRRQEWVKKLCEFGESKRRFRLYGELVFIKDIYIEKLCENRSMYIFEMNNGDVLKLEMSL